MTRQLADLLDRHRVTAVWLFLLAYVLLLDLAGVWPR